MQLNAVNFVIYSYINNNRRHNIDRFLTCRTTTSEDVSDLETWTWKNISYSNVFRVLSIFLRIHDT